MKEIKPLTEDLCAPTWGREQTSDRQAVPALFELTGGLKKNARSPKDLPKDLVDGSSSIASTRGEGDVRGIFLPAVQNTLPQAASHIGHILRILHCLYQLIMPCSVTRFEWEMIRWNSWDNNVHCFGGLGPNGTGCQNNLSSTFNSDLATAIGGQGSWHTDGGDDALWFTLATIILRIPPGSDPRPFLLGRPGLYCHIQCEGELLIVFLVFKGNDPHSGFSPSINVEVCQAWIEAYNKVDALFRRAGPQNRCVYIDYGSMAATVRLAPMSFCPSLRFINDGAPLTRRAKQLNFAAHGAVVLGDAHARANRLGRELAYGYWNGLQHCNLRLKVPIDTFLSQVEYLDEDGVPHAFDPSPIKMDTEEDYQRLKPFSL